MNIKIGCFVDPSYLYFKSKFYKILSRHFLEMTKNTVLRKLTLYTKLFNFPSEANFCKGFVLKYSYRKHFLYIYWIINFVVALKCIRHLKYVIRMLQVRTKILLFLTNHYHLIMIDILMEIWGNKFIHHNLLSMKIHYLLLFDFYIWNLIFIVFTQTRNIINQCI